MRLRPIMEEYEELSADIDALLTPERTLACLRNAYAHLDQVVPSGGEQATPSIGVRLARYGENPAEATRLLAAIGPSEAFGRARAQVAEGDALGLASTLKAALDLLHLAPQFEPLVDYIRATAWTTGLYLDWPVWYKPPKRDLDQHNTMYDVYARVEGWRHTPPQQVYRHDPWKVYQPLIMGGNDTHSCFQARRMHTVLRPAFELDGLVSPSEKADDISGETQLVDYRSGSEITHPRSLTPSEPYTAVPSWLTHNARTTHYHLACLNMERDIALWHMGKNCLGCELDDAFEDNLMEEHHMLTSLGTTGSTGFMHCVRCYYDLVGVTLYRMLTGADKGWISSVGLCAFNLFDFYHEFKDKVPSSKYAESYLKDAYVVVGELKKEGAQPKWIADHVNSIKLTGNLGRLHFLCKIASFGKTGATTRLTDAELIQSSSMLAYAVQKNISRTFEAMPHMRPR